MMRLIAALLALFLAAVAHAETRIVTPKNRPAEQVAALVQPLVPAGAGIIAANGQLILHGDSAAIEELATLVDQVDVAAKRLRITVREGGETFRSAEGASVHGSISQPHIGVYSRQSHERPSSERTINVMEGQWARIDAGRSVPFRTQTTIVGPSGVVVQQGTQYENVSSGFEVLPRVSGSTVTLEIRAYQGTPPSRSGDVIGHSETSSNVQIPLGEWTDLSGVSNTENDDGSGTFYAHRSRESDERHLQVKVELVP